MLSQQLLESFQRRLERCPGLALAHPVGQRVYEQVLASRLHTLEESSWYRGLIPKANRRPEPNDFLPPDPACVVVPEQRFNHQGQRTFYLADHPYRAALECREGTEPKVWVQQFHVAGADGILNITTEEELAAVATYCGTPIAGIARPPEVRPQYLVPRFLADCARHRKARGMLVPGAEGGSNLVLFEWAPQQLSPTGEPRQISIR